MSGAEQSLYGGGTAAPKERKPVTLHRIREMQAAGEPITMLTCYDASFAKLLDAAGVDTLLIGDSLGMVLQGRSSTLPVTLEETAYHIRSVQAGNRNAFVLGDMPFGSYQESKEQAMRSATVLMQAGAQMVKLEGGGWTPETVRFLVDRGVPVCAHLGLTPQSVHAIGGYRIQGKSADGAAILKQHAKELSDAGAAMCVLELVPAALAKEITQSVAMATIGIGASSACSGQVLVLHDMLNVTQGKLPRFVRNFMDGAPSIKAAIEAYVAAVKSRSFPDDAVHGY
ncbi:3-methyl-2-oxobutanoate hydroxymethyltransferase [Piscinibacter sp. HJYY11]|uniref:3-methyl-2-oxobutanoate hydroxymethyltransferase n=1 Tax=Piscinibacter sp. HJYY11 TaxID=2801333 RepID=UPI00191D5226|nr:3-methyl-2-oxobutanoate hydroxymethyltransferase [Piscinibacter sp. HJYY11]MBL0730425.1 3-methyl-2-oxobutanoate hydroxymethyltransferase [Piscinibacter sp. HJYY11]